MEHLWGSAEVLRAGAESDTPPGLSPAQMEFDMGYGLVTHEGLGLLTTYGGVALAGPGRHGVRLGGRLALGTWVDLSVEGERTTQGGGAEHQVVLYGDLGWEPTAEPIIFLRRGDACVAPTPPFKTTPPAPLPKGEGIRRSRASSYPAMSMWFALSTGFDDFTDRAQGPRDMPLAHCRKI